MADSTALTTSRTLFGVLVFALAASCDQRSVPAPVQPTPVAAAPTPPVAALPAPVPDSSGASFSGIVREPGAGPIGAVSVSNGWPRAERVYTDASGTFMFAGVVDRYLFFEKPGYRLTTWKKPWPLSDVPARIDIVMQRVLRLGEGVPLTGLIFPDDAEYSVERANTFYEDGDFFCRPCRYISVNPSLPAGRVLRLRWSGEVPLDLSGGEYYAPAPITAMGQPGTSELTAMFATQRVDTIYVGLGRRNGEAQSIRAPIEFTVSVEPTLP